MESKSKAKKVICTAVLILSVFMLGISLSYAFFNNFVKKTDGENNPAVVKSGELDITFNTSQYINNNSAELVEEADLQDDANYASKFTVDKSSKSTAKNIKYDIYLKDIKISDNLKDSPYLKWKLLNVKTGESIKGNFTDIVKDKCSSGSGTCYKKYLKSNITLTAATDYILYIYLEYSATENQNSILEGTLSTKVAIDSYTY